MRILTDQTTLQEGDTIYTNKHPDYPLLVLSCYHDSFTDTSPSSYSEWYSCELMDTDGGIYDRPIDIWDGYLHCPDTGGEMIVLRHT